MRDAVDSRSRSKHRSGSHTDHPRVIASTSAKCGLPPLTLLYPHGWSLRISLGAADSGLTGGQLWNNQPDHEPTHRTRNQLAREAKAIVALAFRNGPIEDLHAGKPCSTCFGRTEYWHVTDEEMHSIL